MTLTIPPVKILKPVLALLFSLLSLGAMAQETEVSGTVLDNQGVPLFGANVIIKGTSRGTIADSEGQFSLPANVGEVLQISYTGFLTQEVPVESANQTFTINMEVDSAVLEEVVVIGYGSVDKSDLTGSISSIEVENIADIPSNSVEGLLQGRAAGLQVMNTSQDPGAGAIIRIRGNSSLNGSNTPLIVVNGFPLGDAGNLSQINPATIESVEVLKDASATAVYGSRGANGVIMITTKTAKEGVSNLQVKHQTSIGEFTSDFDIWRDPLLMAEIANEEQFNGGLSPIYTGQFNNGIYYPSLIEIQAGEWSNTDWTEVTFRTPILNNSTISMSSANEKTSFNMDLNYFHDQGVFIEDYYRKVNGNIQVRYEAFENLTLSSSNIISASKRQINNTLQYGRNPLWPVYNEDGTYFRASPTDYGHPLIATEDIMNENQGRDFITSQAVDWEIVPDLKLRSQFNYRYSSSAADSYFASNTSAEAFADKGIAQMNKTTDQELLTETYLTYSRTINSNHFLSVMAGHSYSHEMPRGLYTSARGFVNDAIGNENMGAGDPERRSLSNSYQPSELLSYYSRINYSLMDKYLLTATMRADGSSKFGSENKWGYFPSGALSWKLHQEDWVQQLEVFDHFKLRGSYGLSGNQGISPYQTLDRYGMENYWSGGRWNTVIGPGYEVGRVGANDRYILWGGISNPELKWESTTQFNIGADLAFFGDRLNLTVDYYNKRTTDLLREKYLPLSSSFDKIWVNDGSISNEGIEVSLEGDIINTKDWGLSAALVYSRNRNEITSLGDAISSGLSEDPLTGMNYEVAGPSIDMFNGNVNVFAIGQPMFAFYGYKVDGIIQDGEDPGFISTDGKDLPGELQYVDLNGDYEIDEQDRSIIGDPNPDFTGSLNLSMRWRNFDMSVFLYGVYGNDVLHNGLTYSPRVKTRRWTVDNPTEDYPRLNANRNYLFSDYFLEDGSFLRVQNVNLGYTFDLGNSFVKNVRIFSNIENAFTFTRFNGHDPEVGLEGIYWGGYPKLRRYSLGIDINLF